MKGILRPIHRGIFEFCGLSVLEPFIAYAAAHGGEEGRAAYLSQWRDRLELIEREEAVVVGPYA